MIDLKETLVATAVESFNEGVRTERERILQIIQEYRHKPSLTFDSLISLIKGGQE